VDSNVANGRCKSREGLEIISHNSSLHKHVYSKLVNLNMCLIQQDRMLHRLTPTWIHAGNCQWYHSPIQAVEEVEVINSENGYDTVPVRNKFISLWHRPTLILGWPEASIEDLSSNEWWQRTVCWVNKSCGSVTW